LVPRDIKQPTRVAIALKKLGLTLRKAHSVLNQLAEGKAAAVRIQMSDSFKAGSVELGKLGVDALKIEKADPDPRAIRDKLGISQAEFAIRFCLELDTIQNWEQGRSQPDPAAKVLLRVIDKCPDVVESVLTNTSGR
jgi:DNA-binding transcriptional regulator YiaG